MIMIVTLQVFSRFTLPKTPHWTEEAARIFFIYMVSFAACLAVRNKGFINVDTFIRLLPQKAGKIMQVLIHSIIAIFMSIIMIHSIIFIKIGSIQKSPSLQIPMSFIFFSMFILSLLISIYSIREIWTLTNKSTKKTGQINNDTRTV
jgi:TRAP-type C4-dicarboxylate transport system permease small subunit